VLFSDILQLIGKIHFHSVVRYLIYFE